MYSNVTCSITIKKSEKIVIEDILDVLDGCPIELSNDDYVDVFRSIARGDSTANADGIVISYEAGDNS